MQSAIQIKWSHFGFNLFAAFESVYIRRLSELQWNHYHHALLPPSRLTLFERCSLHSEKLLSHNFENWKIRSSQTLILPRANGRKQRWDVANVEKFWNWKRIQHSTRAEHGGKSGKLCQFYSSAIIRKIPYSNIQMQHRIPSVVCACIVAHPPSLRCVRQEPKMCTSKYYTVLTVMCKWMNVGPMVVYNLCDTGEPSFHSALAI